LPRPLAFRAAVLIVPILLAAIPARAAGLAAPPMPTPGASDTSTPTAASGAASRIERAPRHAGPTHGRQPLPSRSPRFIQLPIHREPSLDEAAAAPATIELVLTGRNKPMHLADFLLQTHSAFHLAALLGGASAGSRPANPALGWSSVWPVPIT
jgi:hypothetical protein